MSTPRTPRIVGLIPARGGSKGVPGKNVRPLAGKPLLEYTCAAARASRLLTHVVLSTDADEIAACGRAAGVEVPFARPPELAADNTPTSAVVNHFVAWWAERHAEPPDIVVLLQPTAPLRQAKHIDEALTLLISSRADAVVSVAPAPAHYHPLWQFTIAGGRLAPWDGQPLSRLVPRRQELSPPTYVRNGAVYAFRVDAWKKHGTFYGEHCLAYPMPAELSVNIDTLDDWRAAEAYLQSRENLRAVG